MSTPRLAKNDKGYFEARWSDNRRSRRKSMGTQDRSVAEARFAQWLLIRNDGPQDADRAYTVAEAWTRYEAKTPSAQTATAGYSWKNLEPHFGHLAIEAVDQDAVDAYVAKRISGRIGRPSKPATCRRELAVLIAALNFGAKGGRRALYSAALLNPIDLPPSSPPRERWLTAEELKRLFDAARDMRSGDRLSRGELFLWLALETAARKGAILDLTWDRVDLEAGVIRYDVPGRAATKKRRADVPISDTLRAVLERARDERENDLVMGDKSDPYGTVRRIAARADLEGVSPHVLRHTAATHMARNGVPLWTVAKVLGNTLAMTEKVYAKWAPSEPERNVNLISKGMLEVEE